MFFFIANLICCIYVYLFSYILFVYMCARISFQLVCVCVFILLFRSAHMLHHLNISAIWESVVWTHITCVETWLLTAFKLQQTTYEVIQMIRYLRGQRDGVFILWMDSQVHDFPCLSDLPLLKIVACCSRPGWESVGRFQLGERWRNIFDMHSLCFHAITNKTCSVFYLQIYNTLSVQKIQI